MERDLHLSSPNMHGDDVAYAQRLVEDGAFDFDVLCGREGVYDAKTAAAVRRAKWLLGYPTGGVDTVFGTQLEKYLRKQEPNDPLPAAYKTRRAARLKAEAANRDIGLKALAEAKKWIGTKEEPANSNRVKPFGPWYRGYVGPWCAVFVSFCLAKAGFKHAEPGRFWSYCPYMVSDANDGRNGLRRVSAAKVQPGDVVLYDWDGGVSDHVGFFEKWIVKGVSFHAIEGNTAVGNDSNGGQVMRRERRVGQVECFARVSDA